MNSTQAAKHTPGPWHLSRNFGYVRKNTGHTDDGPKDFNIASIHDFGDEAEVQANARLIGAAPELYKGLALLLPVCKAWLADAKSSDPKGWQSLDDDIAFAEAAIRKAKGEL